MLAILLIERRMTIADLEKKSGVAHATIFDLYSGKTDFKKCSVENAIKIANALNMDVKELYERLTRIDYTNMIINHEFDLFRSAILHELKRTRWDVFKKKYTKEVKDLFANKQYDKSLYLVTLIDDLSKKHNEKLDNKLDSIRDYKLDKLLVPSSVYLELSMDASRYHELFKNASMPFLKKNILEERNYYE